VGKFAGCAQRALPPPRIAQLFEQLARIEQVEGVGELTRLMEMPAAARPAQAA